MEFRRVRHAGVPYELAEQYYQEGAREELNSFHAWSFDVEEIVYGPVWSWRLGRSLGVDPICKRVKVCSFDCIYCSLGPTGEKSVERRTFVSPEEVSQELERAMRRVEADVVTFSGTGEPTLARNLGKLIKVARRVSGLPVAVLTNSSLMGREDVRGDLAEADIVKGKLDAPNQELLGKVNRPHAKVRFEEMVEGMREFRREFGGRFAVEVMFIPENRSRAGEIAGLLRGMALDEIQVNTPLRPSPIRPLSREELEEVERSFEGMNFRSVYGARKSKISQVVGREKLRLLKRAN